MDDGQHRDGGAKARALRCIAWVGVALVATAIDVGTALATSATDARGAVAVVMLARLLATCLSAPLLAHLLVGRRANAARSAGRAVHAQLATDGLSLAAFVVVTFIGSVFGRDVGAGFGSIAVVLVQLGAAYATRLAILEDVTPLAAIERSMVLLRAAPSRVLVPLGCFAVTALGAAAFTPVSMLGSLLVLVLARAAFEAALTRGLRETRDTTPAAPLRAASARAASAVEYALVLLAVLVAGAGAYRLTGATTKGGYEEAARCLDGSCEGGSGGAVTTPPAQARGGAREPSGDFGRYLAERVLGAREAGRSSVLAEGFQVAAADTVASDATPPIVPTTPAERARALAERARDARRELDDPSRLPPPGRARALADEARRAAAELDALEMDVMRDRNADRRTQRLVARDAGAARNDARVAEARAEQSAARTNFRERVVPLAQSYGAGFVAGGYANDHSTAALAGQITAYFIPYVNGAALVRDFVHGTQEIVRTGGRSGWLEAGGSVVGGALSAGPRVVAMMRPGARAMEESAAATGAAAAHVDDACGVICRHRAEPPPARLTTHLDEIIARDPEEAGVALWASRDRYNNPALRSYPATTPEAIAIREAIENGEVRIRMLPHDSPSHGGFRPPLNGEPAVIEIAYEGASVGARQRMLDTIYHEGRHYRQWVEAGRPDAQAFLRHYHQNWWWMETEAEVIARSRAGPLSDEAIVRIKQEHTALYRDGRPPPPPGYMDSPVVRPPGVSAGPTPPPN